MTIPDLNDVARYRQDCAALIERLGAGDRSAVADARRVLAGIATADRAVDDAYRRAVGVERTGGGHVFTLVGADRLATLLDGLDAHDDAGGDSMSVVEVDGRLGVVVAEQAGEILALRRLVDAVRTELVELRGELQREIRTERLVVATGLRHVEVTPGSVELIHERNPNQPDSGSRVPLRAFEGSAGVTVAAAEHADEPNVSVSLCADGCESEPSAAMVEMSAPGVDGNYNRYRNLTVTVDDEVPV